MYHKVTFYKAKATAMKAVDGRRWTVCDHLPCKSQPPVVRFAQNKSKRRRCRATGAGQTVTVYREIDRTGAERPKTVHISMFSYRDCYFKMQGSFGKAFKYNQKQKYSSLPKILPPFLQAQSWKVNQSNVIPAETGCCLVPSRSFQICVTYTWLYTSTFHTLTMYCLHSKVSRSLGAAVSAALHQF